MAGDYVSELADNGFDSMDVIATLSDTDPRKIKRLRARPEQHLRLSARSHRGRNNGNRPQKLLDGVGTAYPRREQRESGAQRLTGSWSKLNSTQWPLIDWLCVSLLFL